MLANVSALNDLNYFVFFDIVWKLIKIQINNNYIERVEVQSGVLTVVAQFRKFVDVESVKSDRKSG